MPAKILGGAAEVYYKPSTGQLVMRKIGLDTTTEKWQTRVKPRTIEFARRMSGHRFPAECKKSDKLPKGQAWRAFKACLRVKGAEQWKKG